MEGLITISNIGRLLESELLLSASFLPYKLENYSPIYAVLEAGML